MLQSLKHRGPDSTGFALYGTPTANEYVMRLKLAEQEDMAQAFDIHQKIRQRQAEVDSAYGRARRRDHRGSRGHGLRLSLSHPL